MLWHRFRRPSLSGTRKTPVRGRTPLVQTLPRRSFATSFLKTSPAGSSSPVDEIADLPGSLHLLRGERTLRQSAQTLLHLFRRPRPSMA